MVSGVQPGASVAGGDRRSDGGGGVAGLRRSTLARLRELGLRPSRERGQNFLVDPRFLDVVESAAALSRSDAVLEVGGGLGVLSERLAARSGHVHVVEIDRTLARGLERLLAPLPNTTLHVADAARMGLRELEPRPTKLVANLPYGVATTVLLKALEELPDADLLVAMVQREVAERLAADPGSRTYGATSVLAQLCCEVRIARRVPRSAFHPAPRVDSAIVVLRRRAPTPSPAVRALVRDAFAHRRKTLAGSLALAHGADPHTRERAREALVAIGHPADARAERLSPSELQALATLLAPEQVDGRPGTPATGAAARTPGSSP